MLNPTIKKPLTSNALYVRTLIFSLVVFGLFYAYTSWLKIPSVLNKSAADTSIFFIGLSMLLSSVCYYWNMFDWSIRYRKQLGMVGWAFGIAHVILSFSALQSLLKVENWQNGLIWPAFTGLVATLIFTGMALISNNRMAAALGAKWRPLLRVGYLAVILILAHVVLLKSSRWITWFEGGMKTPPSSSLIVALFMVVVLLMRAALWISLSRKKDLA